MALQIGDKVPHFKSIDDQGNSFQSNELLGVTPMIIYFYPKNFTPGCTKEACDFRDYYHDFKNHGYEVIGISSDSVKSHQRFKNKYHLPFPFLSDKNGKLRELFGVKSKLFGLLPGRETFVINKEGEVQLRFDSIKASKHISEVLKVVK